MKKLQSNPTEVNLPIEKIKEEFETLFNSKLVVNSTQENEANKKIKEFLAANSNTENHNIDRIAIEASTIKSIIDKLPFNNSGGQSGLTNQLMKVSAIEETIQILKHTIQEMIDSAYFPYNFNTAQMFALVKDSKKDSADPNNIRPISVSDVITNIFERIILQEITVKSREIFKKNTRLN